MPAPVGVPGWDDAWAAAARTALTSRTALTARTALTSRTALTAHAARPGPTGHLVGRVCRADRGACDVLAVLEAGDPPTTLTAGWSAAVTAVTASDPSLGPATGDWVVLARSPVSGAPDRWTLEDVLPRRSAVVRAQVTPGSSHDQVLAANADIVAIVEGLHPDADPGRIERLLALAWSSGCRPVVLLTKADLVAHPEAMGHEVELLAPGVEVLVVSAATGEGLDPLRGWLVAGATVALLGASGVGKSTLLNALTVVSGAGVMRTQALRADGKGRHTTVTRELHPVVGGGAVLDTPGLRSVGITGHDALSDVFPEVEELAEGCRFRDCEHRTEPGCAVIEAVEAGDLPPRRLDSYRKLQREAAYRAARVDARLRAAQAGRVRAKQRAFRSKTNRR